MQEMRVLSLSQEESLGKEMAIHSDILVWEIPLTEEPGRLSPWSLKKLDMTWQINNHKNKNSPASQSIHISCRTTTKNLIYFLNLNQIFMNNQHTRKKTYFLFSFSLGFPSNRTVILLNFPVKMQVMGRGGRKTRKIDWDHSVQSLNLETQSRLAVQVAIVNLIYLINSQHQENT